MVALRSTSPGVLELQRVRHPVAQPGEVYIRVLLAGICGTDVEIADGVMAYFTSGAAAYPVTLGHEWVGEVAAIGEGLDDSLALGDRVVGECSVSCAQCATCASGAYHRCATRTETGILNRDGALAEFLVLPRRSVHVVRPSVPLRAAALIEPTAVALNAVRLGGVGPASVVAVIGDGPIGLLILLVARAAGAAVVVVGADDARLALAARLGATATIDVRGAAAAAATAVGGSTAAYAATAAATAARILAALGGRRPTAIFEASGSAAGVESAVAVAAPGATVVLVGLCGSAARPPALDLDRVVVYDLTLRGALGSPGRWPEAIALVESGAVDPGALVTHELPLAEWPEAFALVRSRAAVKVLLRPESTS
jgi:L-iditol 2-dehydrogenase